MAVTTFKFVLIYSGFILLYFKAEFLFTILNHYKLPKLPFYQLVGVCNPSDF